MIKITIEKITCHKRSEFKGRKDNIYLKQAGRAGKLWPQRKKAYNIKLGETIEPNYSHYYKPSETITLELWEYDPGPIKDDLLGSISFNKGSCGRFRKFMDGDGGYYEVIYNVENPEVENPKIENPNKALNNQGTEEPQPTEKPTNKQPTSTTVSVAKGGKSSEKSKRQENTITSTEKGMSTQQATATSINTHVPSPGARTPLEGGLEDYAYWLQEIAKEQAAKSGEEKKPFRRGRIWT